MLAQREVASFVYDAVQLEGINFTLPEIQTLMEGVTVGGHKLSDQQIALNQAQAWKQLFAWIKSDEFEITPDKACELHTIAGKEEALEWGQFRSEVPPLQEQSICRLVRMNYLIGLKLWFRIW